MARRQSTRAAKERPHVVIVGAGFGGLWAAKALANAPVQVTLFDRNNYHTFLPLLYQVAAAELEPVQIGYPVRAILRRLQNVNFVLAEITGLDLAAQTVSTTAETIAYDYLILATGSVSRFFGIPGAGEHAFSLKTMEEGIQLRNHILRCFELAVREPDASRRRQLLTFVVTGGGPTGVEYAGALSELIYGPLAKDYPELDMSEVTIMLVEAMDGLLGGMPAKLGRYAASRLQKMGVELRLGTRVTGVTPASVLFGDDTAVSTHTVVWTVGVGGDALGRKAGLETLPNGTVPVLPTLQAGGFPNVYVVGDLAAFAAVDEYLPMLAPVATQQGAAAAENIKRQIAGDPLISFHYKDSGTMATIGRNAAVAHIGHRALTGFVAWFMWLAVHLMNLIGFRNRLTVLINWAWSYFFYERVVRLILPSSLDKSESVLFSANSQPIRQRQVEHITLEKNS